MFGVRECRIPRQKKEKKKVGKPIGDPVRGRDAPIIISSRQITIHVYGGDQLLNHLDKVLYCPYELVFCPDDILIHPENIFFFFVRH